MRARKRPLRILVTGFRPFPGAPVNPTTALVRRLARRADLAADIHLAVHVFATRYAVVDRALPRLLAKQRPDALVMFGVATRARAVRIETRARNRIGAHADAGGAIRGPGSILRGAPRDLPLRAPAVALLRAAGRGGLPARLSRNAGDYLCNYAFWQALCAKRHRPALVAFVHVPALSARFDAAALDAAAKAILDAAAAALRRRRAHGR